MRWVPRMCQDDHQPACLRPILTVVVIAAVSGLVACRTAMPAGSELWRAFATSDTGRSWTSELSIVGDRYRGTIRCEPFGALEVSGTITADRHVGFSVNPGRREIPAMGEYWVKGAFPSLEIVAMGGRCGTAKLEYRLVRAAQSVAHGGPPLKTPLPADMSIVPPAPDVPSAIAAFSGIWTGRWSNVEGNLEHTFVVEKIEKHGDAITAVVLYSHDIEPRWGIRSPNVVRTTGTFGHDGVLRLKTFPNSAQVEYIISPDGASLSGSYVHRGRTTRGDFVRHARTTVAGGTQATPPAPEAERPLSEIVTLEVSAPPGSRVSIDGGPPSTALDHPLRFLLKRAPHVVEVTRPGFQIS